MAGRTTARPNRAKPPGTGAKRIGLRHRATTAPPAKTRSSGRYTAPIPQEVKHSPSWYPWVLLTVLIVGVIAIILNYIAVLPKSPSDWYTIGGLFSIVTGALLGTRYR